MKRYVLDAGVAVKWYLALPSEPLLAEAASVLKAFVSGQAELLIPELFFAEFANVFWKAERQGRCDAKTSIRAVTNVTGYGFGTFRIAPLVPAAAALARRYGCTVYDGLYLALAVEQAAPLITADERLAAAVRGVAPVVSLANFPAA